KGRKSVGALRKCSCVRTVQISGDYRTPPTGKAASDGNCGRWLSQAGAHLMELEQLEVQRSWRAGRNPVMPALLAGINNQDELSVAIHFDRDTPSGRALRTM